MAKITEFEKVCIKKDGSVSHRAHYLFGTSSSDATVVIHPWHVTSGRGFKTIVDNAEQIRRILRSIKCPFIEGNDAPRGGKSGAFISIRKQDLLDGLISTFGTEKGRALYTGLGLSSVLSEQTIEDLKCMPARQAYTLSAYYKDAWKVLHWYMNKDRCIAVFPDEE